MADSKISELTELAETPASGDMIPILDVSVAAASQNKRVSRTNLIAGLAPTASPTFTGTLTVPTGLTGVLRADSGVVSTDADVTDLVTAASDTAAGKVELATTAETTTGTDATRAVTPDGLHDMTSLAGAAWFLDEDDMASNSATKTSSQQSVKAYVDAAVLAGGGYTNEQAQDVVGAMVDSANGSIVPTYDDGAGTLDLVVDESVLTTDLENSANGIPVFGILPVANGGSGVGTITGIIKGNGTSDFSAATAGTDYTSPTSTETMTNKTLTSPKINENVAITATATELNYTDGVTSAIQTQLDAKLDSSAYDDATGAETTTGTSTAKYVSPDGLAGSDYGKRTIGLLVTDPGGDAITTGNGKVVARIPSVMNGWNLVSVAANLTTVSSSGAPAVMVRRSRRTNATTRADQDMLTTAITIDANEFDTVDAATPAVIDTSNDDVNTGDHVYIDIDTAGTGAKGLFVELTFQLP